MVIFLLSSTVYAADSDGDGVDDSVDICNGFDDNVDTDSDTYPDGCDLDDDNDGILDANGVSANPECTALPNIDYPNVPSNVKGFTGTSYNGLSSPLNGISYDVNFVSWDTSSNTKNENKDTSTSNGAAIDLHTGTNLIHGWTINNYDLRFENINAVKDQLFYTAYALKNGKVMTLTAYDADGVVIPLTGSTVLGTYLNANGGTANWDDTTGILTTPGGGASALGVILDLSGFNIKELKVEFVTDINDGFAIGLAGLALCDTDINNTPNHLDTDSDGDGCFDALEGNKTVLASQLTASGAIDIATTGGVDGNGVPVLVSGGQADVSSTDAGTKPLACQSSNISVVKAFASGEPSTYASSDTVTYTITVSNAGPDSATNVKVTDLPTNLTNLSIFAATTTDCTIGAISTDIICTISSLAKDANETITVKATAP